MDEKGFLKELLNKRLRIGLRDGRVIDGLFMCTDNACNIVLSNCEEFLTQADVGMSSLLQLRWCYLWFSLIDEVERNPSSKTANIRTLALAIVPGQEIMSILVADNFLSAETVEYINARTTDSVEKN